MEEKINGIRSLFEKSSAEVTDLKTCDELRIKFLGKKGYVTEMMPMLRNVPNEQRPEMGKKINLLKNSIEEKLAQLFAKIEKDELNNKISQAKKIDITLPYKATKGSLHPRSIIRKEIEDIFVSMGFKIEDGNEIVTEYECFDAVNIPATHPARDMQDTFWLDNGQLLRTHTSALQNKVLRKYANQPIKAIMPGRCYRNEELDNSHENTFFQLEGMVVDKNLSIANLIFFMKELLSRIFGKDVNVRLRPGYFSFTEPSFELDATCAFCGGKGCPTCKNSGWIELCPCGMIHPNVLKNGGFDPNEFNGIAFGLGFDRLVMLKYGFNDIRVLNSGNLKILNQIGVN